MPPRTLILSPTTLSFFRYHHRLESSPRSLYRERCITIFGLQHRPHSRKHHTGQIGTLPDPISRIPVNSRLISPNGAHPVLGPRPHCHSWATPTMLPFRRATPISSESHAEAFILIPLRTSAHPSCLAPTSHLVHRPLFISRHKRCPTPCASSLSSHASGVLYLAHPSFFAPRAPILGSIRINTPRFLGLASGVHDLAFSVSSAPCASGTGVLSFRALV
ncbi:hypothetical protein C8F01DRAFT_2179 [Mycena amicta]|nr:hypothetical protein C8F01DRAFT_2179 [Mycena amicta]